MSDTVIKVEKVSKMYQLGSIGSGTLYHTIWHYLNKLKGSKLDKRKDNEFWALKDLNFEVNRGEVIGIIGKNGAGKSTLLKVLSRITEPTSGKITVRGRIASLLEVGTGFHPELSGRENIFLNGSILGMNRKEVKSKFSEIVEFSGIGQFIDTPVKRYSSGMYVRLAFAVAAHLEPEILVVDEVLSVGDAEFQRKCLGKMNDVSKSGRTILFVSHNMAAVRNLCSKGIVLNNGEISFIGNINNAIGSYLSGLKKDVSEIVDMSRIDEMRTEGFQITDIIVENLNDEIRDYNTFRVGDGLSIKIKYKASKKFIGPSIVLRCYDSFDVEVFRLANMPISGYQIGDLKNEGIIECKIYELPVTDGLISFDVGFVRERIEWYFNCERVINIEIEPHDVYNSGFTLNRSRGTMWVKHDWHHKAE